MVLSLDRWMAIDETVFQWIQFHRSCAMDASSHWIDGVVRTVLMLLLGAALVGGEWRHPGRLLGWLTLFLVGAGGVELLKTALERLRPRSTPGTITGNSFPSGHITGATMLAVIVIVLVRRRDWPVWARWCVYSLASACIAVQAAGRLVSGSHWMTDVVASTLLGIAWVLAAGWFRRLPRAVVAGVLAGACVVFLLFDDVPGLRIHLPSALDDSGRSVAAVEFGTAEARSARIGRWEDGGVEPIGPVSWALSPDVGVALEVGAQVDGVLKVTLRPLTVDGRSRCARVLISVNDWVAPQIALARGWREYHLDPPPGVIHRGRNTIRFHIAADPSAVDEPRPARLAAFRYVRLSPRA